MNQYIEPAHPVLQQICADDAIFCTEDLFVLVEEEEHPNGHSGYTYTFANTEAGIRAHMHVSELMEKEDPPYELHLWLDAMTEVFGVDMIWAPVVRNERIEFEAVVWA